MVRRADDSCGYYKCTFRQVAFIRHWTELCYPCCLARKALKYPDGYKYEYHAELWEKYMTARIRELRQLFTASVLNQDIWNEFSCDITGTPRYREVP